MMTVVKRNKMGARRGVILIITLWILAILATVSLTYAYYARLDTRMTGYIANSVRARYLAKSGYYRALVYLRDDTLKDMDLLDNEDLIEIEDEDKGFRYDAYNEEWFSKSEALREVEFGQGTFSVNVYDESAKIALNAVPQDLIKDLLMVTGVEEGQAMALSAAIVDWRDEDDLPSDGGDEVDFGEETSEASYYNPEQHKDELKDRGPAYVCKDDVFTDIDELLLVYGMTPEIFYGEDANGNGKLDANENDGNASPPADNEDNELFLGLKPFLTVYSNRLNVNTAQKKVLEALLTSYDDSAAEDLAEKIVEYRAGSDDEPGTDDDRPLRTIDDTDGDDYDLRKVLPMGEDWFRVLSTSQALVVNSSVFTIESVGVVNGIERMVRATVFREFTEPLLLEGKETDELRDEEDIEKPETVQFYTLEYMEEGI
jgi:type II secretory pathway component PulK